MAVELRTPGAPADVVLRHLRSAQQPDERFFPTWLQHDAEWSWVHAPDAIHAWDAANLVMGPRLERAGSIELRIFSPPRAAGAFLASLGRVREEHPDVHFGRKFFDPPDASAFGRGVPVGRPLFHRTAAGTERLGVLRQPLSAAREVLAVRVGAGWDATTRDFRGQVSVLEPDAEVCAVVYSRGRADITIAFAAEKELRSEVNSELNFPPNFEGLVLGCIDADFCK